MAMERNGTSKPVGWSNLFAPVVVLTLCAPAVTGRTAFAQGLPQLTVSGGYASVIDYDVTLRGVVAETEYRLTRHIGLVGEVQRTVGSGEGYLSTWTWTDLVASGGVRVSFRPRRKLEPFVHILVGSYRAAGEEAILPGARRTGPPDSYSGYEPVAIFGGGLMVWPTPQVGVRAGVDVQQLAETLPMGRVTVGIVVPLGKR